MRLRQIHRQIHRQIRAGRLFGIPLMIDYTWPPVVVFHLWMLATLWLPARIRPAWPLWQNLLLALLITALFFASIIFHELAHSLIARIEGIRIHDIRLHIFGGWARLIGEPKTAMAEFRVAVAGPAGSFLLGMLFLAGLLGLQQVGSHSGLVLGAIEAVYYLATANIFLAIFNLLPGLPLDGGRAVRALLWHRRGDILSATRTARKMGLIIAASIIAYAIFLLASAITEGVFWRDFLFSAWLIVIGGYLAQAAETDLRNRERQWQGAEATGTVSSRMIDGAVGAVMRQPAISVSPELSIDDFIEQILSEHRLTCFPVARDGRLHGILSLATLRAIPAESWPGLAIRDVMRPVSEDCFVTVLASLAHAHGKLHRSPHGFLAVIDPQGLLVGYLEAADLSRLSSPSEDVPAG